MFTVQKDVILLKLHNREANIILDLVLIRILAENCYISHSIKLISMSFGNNLKLK